MGILSALKHPLAVIAAAALFAATPVAADPLEDWISEKTGIPDVQLDYSEFGPDPEAQFIHIVGDIIYVIITDDYSTHYVAFQPGKRPVYGSVRSAPMASRCDGMIGHFTRNGAGHCIPHSILDYTVGERAGTPERPRECTITVGGKFAPGHDHSC